MASITELADGKKNLQFYDHNRVRRSIRLGKMNKKQVERIAERIEWLVAAVRGRTILDGDTVKWLAEISDDLHARLGAFGLCESRVRPEPEIQAKLDEFLNEYMAMRTDVKPSTRMHLEQARSKLIEFLGGDRTLASVTPLEAEGFRAFLRRTLGDNTTRRMTGRARQFFAAAVRGRKIAENPFGHLKGLNVRAVKDRQVFVTREAIWKVIDAAPDAEWRAIIALVRFGGLRCPSEIFALKWSDIDWTNKRFIVHSPKTEHHEGHDQRVVTLFPELEPWLAAARDQAKPGDRHVVSRHRSASGNLGTTFKKIIIRAGVKPWPKLFVNLRASRATELVETPGVSSETAAKQLGHSEKIASQFYRMTTDTQLDRLASVPTGPMHPGVMHALMQSGTEWSTTEGQYGNLAHEKTPVNPGFLEKQGSLETASSSQTRTRTLDLAVNSRLLYR